VRQICDGIDCRIKFGTTNKRKLKKETLDRCVNAVTERSFFSIVDAKLLPNSGMEGKSMRSLSLSLSQRKPSIFLFLLIFYREKRRPSIKFTKYKILSIYSLIWIDLINISHVLLNISHVQQEYNTPSHMG
jgi:hypothetical protein